MFGIFKFAITFPCVGVKLHTKIGLRNYCLNRFQFSKMKCVSERGSDMGGVFVEMDWYSA
jgi:hypothetical protein